MGHTAIPKWVVLVMESQPGVYDGPKKSTESVVDKMQSKYLYFSVVGGDFLGFSKLQPNLF
jgi:hypothetical protein